MRLLLVCLLPLALACAGPSTEGASEAPIEEPTPDVKKETVNEPGPLPKLYTRFRDQGCDTERVFSPLRARLLRNTPFAIRGHRFKDPELTRIFEADGDWYRPSNNAVTLDELDASCIAHIKRREALLNSAICVPEPSLQALTRSNDTVRWHVATGLSGLTGKADPRQTIIDPPPKGLDPCAPPPYQQGAPEWSHSRWEIQVLDDTPEDKAIDVLVAGSMPNTALFMKERRNSMKEGLSKLGSNSYRCVFFKTSGESWHPEEMVGGASARTCCSAGAIPSEAPYCASGSNP